VAQAVRRPDDDDLVADAHDVGVAQPGGLDSRRHALELKSERSAAGSEATTRACTVSPPRNSTLISSMACTTWDAVMTLPSAEMSTPEPVSLKPTRPLPVSAASCPGPR
jgi:hypothetical protein